MQPISKKVTKKGHIILTCKKPILAGILNKKVKYIATKESPKGYWNWKELKSKAELDEILSYELDILCKSMK